MQFTNQHPTVDETHTQFDFLINSKSINHSKRTLDNGVHTAKRYGRFLFFKHSFLLYITGERHAQRFNKSSA